MKHKQHPHPPKVRLQQLKKSLFQLNPNGNHVDWRCTNTGSGRFKGLDLLRMGILNHFCLFQQTTILAIPLHVRLQIQLLRWRAWIFGQKKQRWTMWSSTTTILGWTCDQNTTKVSFRRWFSSKSSYLNLFSHQSQQRPCWSHLHLTLSLWLSEETLRQETRHNVIQQHQLSQLPQQRLHGIEVFTTLVN